MHGMLDRFVGWKTNQDVHSIIRDYYAPMEKDARKPRIFGMTASPVDGEAGQDEVLQLAGSVQIGLE